DSPGCVPSSGEAVKPRKLTSGWNGFPWAALTVTLSRPRSMKSGSVSTPGLRSSAAPPVCTLAGMLSRGAPTPGNGGVPITSTTGSLWASAGAQAAHASIPSNRLVEARNVVRQVLDVPLADGLGDARHVARVVGARARLERLELLDHVLGVLPRDARYL